MTAFEDAEVDLVGSDPYTRAKADGQGSGGCFSPSKRSHPFTCLTEKSHWLWHIYGLNAYVFIAFLILIDYPHQGRHGTSSVCVLSKPRIEIPEPRGLASSVLEFAKLVRSLGRWLEQAPHQRGTNRRHRLGTTTQLLLWLLTAVRSRGFWYP